MKSRNIGINLTLIIILLLGLFGSASAEQLMVIGWNVESGGCDPGVISASIEEIDGCDIWGLSEVDASWARSFEQAAENDENADFKYILGSSGGGDRLMIVYNANRLEELSHREIDAINLGGRVRAPLVAHFRIKGTSEEFLFMVNHLYRGNNQARHEQARLLNEWAQVQPYPVIAVGDYNFDWELPNGDRNHDRGYDNMVNGEVFKWVRPGQLMPTQCHERYRSVLDFVFVSGVAKNWTASSDILFPEPTYCPDDSSKSDHRPVRASLQTISTGTMPGEPGVGTVPSGTRDALLEQIRKIQQQLNELKSQVERMN
jgi:endonuclease/exonuclease/phosphatase family metal-dependent hydrolase